MTDILKLQNLLIKKIQITKNNTTTIVAENSKFSITFNLINVSPVDYQNLFEIHNFQIISIKKGIAEYEILLYVANPALNHKHGIAAILCSRGYIIEKKLKIEIEDIILSLENQTYTLNMVLLVDGQKYTYELQFDESEKEYLKHINDILALNNPDAENLFLNNSFNLFGKQLTLKEGAK